MHRGCRNQWWRLVAGALAALCVTASLSACQGNEEPRSAPTSVEAFPDPPRAVGPIEVELRPALALMTGDRRCRAEQDSSLLCATDGSGGYRAVGTSGPVVVAEVRTAPSADHTSWDTTIRFAAGSRAAVRRAREQAAGIGGVLVVTAATGVVVVVAPADVSARRAALLGLEKAEAWSFVNAFVKAQTRSKQGM